MKKIKDALIGYGLTKHESSTYLSLAKMLEANVTQLSHATKIPRATIYKALDVLETHNLISKFKKNNVLHFTLTNVKQLKRNLDEKTLAIEDIIPDLKELIHTASKEPKIQLFTGKEGLRLMLEELIEETDRMGLDKSYAIAGLGAYKHLPRYFYKWKEHQKKQGITSYVCFPESVRRLHEENAHLKRSSYIKKRYYSDDFAFKGTLQISGEKIGIGSFELDNPHATIIHSPELVHLFMMVWKIVWNASSE